MDGPAASTVLGRSRRGPRWPRTDWRGIVEKDPQDWDPSRKRQRPSPDKNNSIRVWCNASTWMWAKPRSWSKNLHMSSKFTNSVVTTVSVTITLLGNRDNSVVTTASVTITLSSKFTTVLLQLHQSQLRCLVTETTMLLQLHQSQLRCQASSPQCCYNCISHNYAVKQVHHSVVTTASVTITLLGNRDNSVVTTASVTITLLANREDVRGARKLSVEIWRSHGLTASQNISTIMAQHIASTK